MNVGDVLTLDGQRWRVALILRDGGVALIPAQFTDMAASPRVWTVPASKLGGEQIEIAGEKATILRPGWVRFDR